MTVCTQKVYIAQVRLHTRRVHTRAMPVLLKICIIPMFLCVYPVSVLLKYHDDTSTIFPTKVCTSPRYASITDMSMPMLCLFSLKYDATPFLLCVHVVTAFLKI